MLINLHLQTWRKIKLSERRNSFRCTNSALQLGTVRQQQSTCCGTYLCSKFANNNEQYTRKTVAFNMRNTQSLDIKRKPSITCSSTDRPIDNFHKVRIWEHLSTHYNIVLCTHFTTFVRILLWKTMKFMLNIWEWCSMFRYIDFCPLKRSDSYCLFLERVRKQCLGVVWSSVNLENTIPYSLIRLYNSSIELIGSALELTRYMYLNKYTNWYTL